VPAMRAVRSRFAVLTLAAVAPLMLAACGPKPTEEKTGRGVLVIAIDGLRTDHLSCAGYDRPTSRVLDGLAKQGVFFDNAWSSAPRAQPAHVSLLTGCDPWIARRAHAGAEEGSEGVSWRIPAGAPNVAREFLAHGFETAAFLPSNELTPLVGLSGGFQLCSVPAGDATERFDGVAQRFANWLTDQGGATKWFAYLQVDDLVSAWSRPAADERTDTLFTPRAELDEVPPVSAAENAFFALPTGRWSGGALSVGEYEARYDGRLRGLDDQLGALFERLRRAGRLRATTVIVTGSFGTAFGESGLYLSSGTLADGELRVPLIVRPALAIELERGRTSSALVGTADIVPTLLELHDIARPRGLHGRSLAGLLRGTASDVPPGHTGLPRTLFASGGLLPGWSAIDATHCLEHVDARVRGAGLVAASYVGERRSQAGEEREFLHARAAPAPDRTPGARGDRASGHLLDAAQDSAARDRLLAAGREWFAWMERARRLLQDPRPLGEDAERRAEYELLRARDLVGDLP